MSNKAVRDDGLLEELPEQVVIFGVRWKRRKGQPLQIVNSVCPMGVLNILATHDEIAKQCKVPHSWVEYKIFTRSAAPPAKEGTR